MKSVLAIIATAVGVLASTYAGAATIITNRAAFDALGGGTSYFEDFNSFEQVQKNPIEFGSMTATGEIVGPLRTDTPDMNGNVNGTNYLYYRLDYWSYWDDKSAGTGKLRSSNPLRMIGFDLHAYQYEGSRMVAYLTDTGETGNFRLPPSGVTDFVGLIFEAPAKSFALLPTWEQGRNSTIWFGLDNLQTYTALAPVSAVPEPATWAMMIVGFCAIGATMRYRRRNLRMCNRQQLRESDPAISL